MTQTLYGFYVSFSGESPDNAVRNVYALNTDGKTVSTQVLGPGPEPYHGLRGMAFGPMAISTSRKASTKTTTPARTPL
jgi:hypothetical protein